MSIPDAESGTTLIILSNRIETNNRRQVENVGSEQKSKKIQKELEKLMKRYPNIGKNEYFISRWGYTLEFNQVE